MSQDEQVLREGKSIVRVDECYSDPCPALPCHAMDDYYAPWSDVCLHNIVGGCIKNLGFDAAQHTCPHL